MGLWRYKLAFFLKECKLNLHLNLNRISFFFLRCRFSRILTAVTLQDQADSWLRWTSLIGRVWGFLRLIEKSTGMFDTAHQETDLSGDLRVLLSQRCDPCLQPNVSREPSLCTPPPVPRCSKTTGRLLQAVPLSFSFLTSLSMRTVSMMSFCLTAQTSPHSEQSIRECFRRNRLFWEHPVSSEMQCGRWRTCPWWFRTSGRHRRQPWEDNLHWSTHTQRRRQRSNSKKQQLTHYSKARRFPSHWLGAKHCNRFCLIRIKAIRVFPQKGKPKRTDHNEDGCKSPRR